MVSYENFCRNVFVGRFYFCPNCQSNDHPLKMVKQLVSNWYDYILCTLIFSVRICQVPGQDNHFDCGVYVCQYVESFFTVIVALLINNYSLELKQASFLFTQVSSTSFSRPEKSRTLIRLHRRS